MLRGSYKKKIMNAFRVESFWKDRRVAKKFPDKRPVLFGEQNQHGGQGGGSRVRKETQIWEAFAWYFLMASPLHSSHFSTGFCVLGGALSRLHGLGSSALRLQPWEPQAERQGVKQKEVGVPSMTGVTSWGLPCSTEGPHPQPGAQRAPTLTTTLLSSFCSPPP